VALEEDLMSSRFGSSVLCLFTLTLATGAQEVAPLELPLEVQDKEGKPIAPVQLTCITAESTVVVHYDGPGTCRLTLPPGSDVKLLVEGAAEEPLRTSLHVPPDTRSILVVLTDEADEDAAVSTVQAGAQDYLVKAEIGPAMLIRSLRHAIERHRLFSALRSLSLIDDLTGLYNRRGFSDLGEQYLKLARRTGRGVTMVYLDLDRFKTINDSLGHHVGDRALLKVADILRATFRRSDIIARLGGDEFGVLALQAADESSELLVERLRESIEDFNESSPEPYQLSVSIGMAHHEDDLRVRLDDMVAEADSAMYREKHGKRAAALRER